MTKEATVSTGEQFWLVMDWIIDVDVNEELDAVLVHLLKDVEESSIPRSIHHAITQVRHVIRHGNETHNRPVLRCINTSCVPRALTGKGCGICSRSG